MIFGNLLLALAMALSEITPEAQTQLELCRRQAEGYRRVAPQTYFLCRSQLKYGLQRVDFLHSWYERPLYQDTTYTNASVKGQWLNRASWRKQVEIGRLGGLDGFSFFPSTKNRDEAIAASLEPGGEIMILPEMIGSDLSPDRALKFCERSVNASNVLRIDGKVVVTMYPAASDAQLKSIQTLREQIAASPLAGKVLFVPYANIFDHTKSFQGLNAERLDAAMVEQAKERVRFIFRHTDGFALHFGSCHSSRHYNRRLVEDVVIPIMQSVAAEEEFRGKKLLGVVYSQGHENNYRWTGIYDSCGTESGRGEWEAICKLKPDFAVAGEWDEENENTHFRPTVSNGRVTQRLLRYYSAVVNDRPLTVFPDDDTSIPNLVLTYRKSLQAGELLDAEVLNIPDGTAGTDEWTVSLKWKNLKGEIVANYAPQRLSARECTAVRLKTPVVDLVANPVLVPELTVVTAKGERVFSDGFWPINLEANRNFDYKWVRGALRELSAGVSASLQIGEIRADGTRIVTGKVKGPKRFRSVEVLSGPDTVYMAGANMPSTNEVTIRIGMQGFDSTSNLNAQTGSIRIENARTLRCTAHAQGRLRQSGNGWEFNKMPLRGRFNASSPGEGSFFATIDLDSVPQAEVVIDLEPTFHQRIRVADLVNRDGLGFNGPKGAYLWVERYFAPEHQPKSWNCDSDEFAFTYQLRDPNAVLRIQTVDEDFRIWRGAAYSFAQTSGPTTVFHVFESAECRVSEVSLPASRVTKLDYDFSGRDGAVLWGGPNRLLPLVPGGTVFPVTFLGMEEAGGHSFPGSCFKDPSVNTVAPQFAEETEGFRSLVFDGHSFLGGGLQMLPQLAGFALEFKLKPDDLKGNQGLIGTGNVGFELSINNGVPTAFISCGTMQQRSHRNAAEGVTIKGPALVVGKWQTLRVVVDQSVAYIEVDGHRGEVLPLSDWRWNPIRANVGFLRAYGESAAMSAGCFRGRIAAIRVEPR